MTTPAFASILALQRAEHPENSHRFGEPGGVHTEQVRQRGVGGASRGLLSHTSHAGVPASTREVGRGSESQRASVSGTQESDARNAEAPSFFFVDAHVDHEPERSAFLPSAVDMSSVRGPHRGVSEAGAPGRSRPSLFGPHATAQLDSLSRSPLVVVRDAVLQDRDPRGLQTAMDPYYPKHHSGQAFYGQSGVSTPTSGLSSPSVGSELSLASPLATSYAGRLPPTSPSIGSSWTTSPRCWSGREGLYGLVPPPPSEDPARIAQQAQSMVDHGSLFHSVPISDDHDVYLHHRDPMPPSAEDGSRSKKPKRPCSQDADEGERDIDDTNKRIKLTSEQRLERSRERNRIHARKTRQRKKMQMERLQETVDQLKAENVALRRELDERIAAIKLLVMRSPDEGDDLLAITDCPADRDSDQSTDSVSEGSSSMSMSKATCDNTDGTSSLGADDGIQLNGMILGVAEMAEMDIDLELMKKDRAQCTPEELEQIRRERNRMHAKRTRVRKKAQLEDIQETIATLEKQNRELVQRISRISSESAHVTVTGLVGVRSKNEIGRPHFQGKSSKEVDDEARRLDARKTIG